MNTYIPKKYQKICLESLKNMRNHGANRALVVMASGLGKTLTSAFDIREYLKTNPNGRVLMLCHSVGILSQAKDVFKDFFGDGYSYGMYNKDEKPTHRTDFLFANLQSVNLHKDEFNPDEFSYIIVDEAHHSSAETFRNAIEHFRPKFLLGMTATPDRMDNADIREIFGEAIFDYPLWDAMKDGWLADVTYRVKTDEIQKLEEILDSGKRFSLSQLNREVFVPKRDEEIVRIIREETQDMDDPTMVIFCQTILHAEEFAKQMGDAVLIHSEMSPDEQHKRLKGFRSGKIKTVCAVDMLNEGIDVPRTDVIVFLRVTQSKIVFTQQLGRGLRRMKGKGKVLVLDFVSTADRLEQLYQCEYEFKSATGRYSRKENANDTSEHFTLDLEKPIFRDREVDILALIERARNFRDISDDEMIRLLRELGEKLGRKPVFNDVCRANGLPSHSAYCRRFGSFGEALALAGYKVKHYHKQFSTKEEILDAIRVKAEEVGRTPTRRDMSADPQMPSCDELIRVFGSFNNAITTAGLTANNTMVDVSDDEMLELLRKKATELGRVPLLREVNEDPNMPHTTTYTTRFGSYDHAVELVGLNRRPGIYSDDDLLEQLRQKIEELGRRPSISDIKNDHSIASYHTFIKHFGSLSKAFKLAGFEMSQSLYSDDDLLEQLRQKTEELGRRPRKFDIDNDPNMAGCTTFRNHFGSLSKALDLALGQQDSRKI